MLTKNHAKLTAEVAAHIKAGAVVKGQYWDGSRGCFIGCLAHASAPSINEETYGLPLAVQRIAESIFENLPADDAKAFFAALPAAVGCDGKDLTRVHWSFLASELRALPKVPDETQAAINPVIAGMDILASGGVWNADAARAAADAARAAARAAADAARAAAYAARAAADADAARAAAYAAYAAAAAADAAAYAAAAAADAAAYAAARAAAYAADAADAARCRQRETLLRFISEAPVTSAA